MTIRLSAHISCDHPGCPNDDYVAFPAASGDPADAPIETMRFVVSVHDAGWEVDGDRHLCRLHNRRGKGRAVSPAPPPRERARS